MSGPDYDRHARIYDRLIGNAAYNRVVWGTHPSQYTAFAAEALDAGEGRYLDAGCGTCVFTAPLYRATARDLVLADLSQGMLDKAAERLKDAPAELLRADLHALPFAPESFDTVACFGMLHVLDDPWLALAALAGHVAPGGRLFASMLVSDRGVGRAYMRLLRRQGELGPPRTEADFATAAREVLGDRARVERTGSMAYLRA